MKPKLIDLVNEIAEEHVAAVSELLDEDYGIETADRKRLREEWGARLAAVINDVAGMEAFIAELSGRGLSEDEIAAFVGAHVGGQ